MQFIKLVHKWASVLVGIQLLIWLLSGLYFNVMDMSKVRGDQYQNKTPPSSSEVFADQPKFIEPKVILEQVQAKHDQGELVTQSIKVISLQGEPYYLLTHHKGLRRHFPSDYSMVDVYTGMPKIIDEELAANIAERSYNGPGELSSAIILTPPIDDMVREKNNVWQINFSDQVNTSVYIDARTGELISHSDDDKRLADFVFMLHFMDYNGVGGFNSWHIILFAIITVWLCLSGFIWTIQLALGGNYRVSYLAKKHQVHIKNQSGKLLTTLSISSHQNLLEGLISQDIAVSSSCGGGGTCGQCKIKVPPSLYCTLAERAHLSLQDINAGYRLACQHHSNEVDEISVLHSAAKKQTLVLANTMFLSPFIKELRFTPPQGETLKFKAGAYMQFNIPAAKGSSIPPSLPSELEPHWQHIAPLDYKHTAISRSYSLANYDTNSNELVFLVKMQPAAEHHTYPGIGSNYICNLLPGESIDTLGPFEKFYARESFNDSPKTMVMIGAGAGMAPLKSIILEQLEKFNSQQDIHYYFGARHEIDLIYRQLFDQLSLQYQNFNYTSVLSKADKYWDGETGYVQQVIERSFATLGHLDQLEFYLCGPKNMMLDTIAMLRNQGVKQTAILCDNFAS